MTSDLHEIRSADGSRCLGWLPFTIAKDSAFYERVVPSPHASALRSIAEDTEPAVEYWVLRVRREPWRSRGVDLDIWSVVPEQEHLLAQDRGFRPSPVYRTATPARPPSLAPTSRRAEFLGKVVAGAWETWFDRRQRQPEMIILPGRETLFLSIRDRSVTEDPAPVFGADFAFTWLLLEDGLLDPQIVTRRVEAALRRKPVSVAEVLDLLEPEDP